MLRNLFELLIRGFEVVMRRGTARDAVLYMMAKDKGVLLQAN